MSSSIAILVFKESIKKPSPRPTKVTQAEDREAKAGQCVKNSYACHNT